MWGAIIVWKHADNPVGACSSRPTVAVALPGLNRDVKWLTATTAWQSQQTWLLSCSEVHVHCVYYSPTYMLWHWKSKFTKQRRNVVFIVPQHRL